MAAFASTSVDISQAYQPDTVQQFLSASGRHLLNLIANGSPTAVVGTDMSWLLCYARRCDVKLDPYQSQAAALKSCFSQAAWRLVCRSGKDCFIPILRNQRLSFESLLLYAETLVEHGFQVAPDPKLLDYLIQSSYYYFDRMPNVPSSKDEMTLLRLATRQGGVSRKDFQRVHKWVALGRGSVSTRMRWPAVLRRANDWHQRQQLVVSQAKASESSHEAETSWNFACTDLPWRGYAITPLTNNIDLWDEGQAMSSCLYRLRHLCDHAEALSRYFSVKKNGRRFATLELVREAPRGGMKGPDRIYGQWRLQDCRLSHNRLPPDELAKKLMDFGWHYNILSQRPNRSPGLLHPLHAGKKARKLPTIDQVAAMKEWLMDQIHRDTADLSGG